MTSCSHRLYVTIFLGVLLLTATAPQPEHDFLLEPFAYSGTSLDISKETKNARATTWKPDGTLLFVTGRDTENVVSYTLSVPWDIGTATFRSMYDFSGHIKSQSGMSVAHGLHIHKDGLQMWIFNRTELWGYTLETPWDITTTRQTQYADFGSFVLRGHDFDFNPEGTRLFIDDRNARAVHEVHLKNPWDLTAYTHVFTLDISDQEKEVRGIAFVGDGTAMLLLDTVRKEILKYQMQEPYALQNARFAGAFDLSGQTNDPRGFSIDEDTGGFYITGRDKERIFQYNRKIP